MCSIVKCSAKHTSVWQFASFVHFHQLSAVNSVVAIRLPLVLFPRPRSAAQPIPATVKWVFMLCFVRKVCYNIILYIQLLYYIFLFKILHSYFLCLLSRQLRSRILNAVLMHHEKLCWPLSALYASVITYIFIYSILLTIIQMWSKWAQFQIFTHKL